MGVVFLSAVGLEMFIVDNVVFREIFIFGGDIEIFSVIGCRISYISEKSIWNCRKIVYILRLNFCFVLIILCFLLDNDNI